MGSPFPMNGPHTPTERLLWAFRHGHGWNPKFPNLRNLDEGRVMKMHGGEEDAKLLIESFQRIDSNVAMLVAAFHGRELQPDGDIGPATEDVMYMRRCAMPDFAPPPEASFNYFDDDLNEAVKSYQDWASKFDMSYEQYSQIRAAGGYVGGSGSWPKGCDPENPDVHSVVTRLNSSAASTHQKGLMTQILKYVEETEAEIGQSVRHVVNTPVANPQHDCSFKFIPGGVIGYAYFPRPNVCNQTATAVIDNSFDAALAVLAELLTHEYKGHSDGLEHTNGGIMNPSIGRPTKRATWIGDPSFNTKKRYFGGVAIPTAPGPGPGPGPGPEPTPTTGVVIRGQFEVVDKATNKVLGKFMAVPTSQV